MAMELICLGVGKGASYVLKGKPSTALALWVAGSPYLLIDCGAGIALACLRHMGEIPAAMLITHNHMDHTGDLPIVLRHTTTRPRVYAHADVIALIQQHRLHDAPAEMASTIAAVDWQPADAGGALTLEHGLKAHLFQSQHSYLCYGFLLTHHDRPLLGYTADSGYVEALYERVSAAPVVIADGRDTASAEHASFAEIEAFAARYPDKRYYVVHHEDASHAFSAPNVALMHEGDRVLLSM